MGKADDYILGEALVDFKESSVIYDASDNLIHVIRLVWIIRDNLVQCIIHPSGRIVCRKKRGFFPVVGWDETQQVLDDLNAFLFVFGSEMCHSALAGMYACSTEVFLSDGLACYGLDHSRTCKEHVGSVLNHDVEISQGRGVNCSSCARTENSRNLRNHT